MLEDQDPFDVFARWLADARESEPNDPTAMSLATVDADGLPDIRMVILNRSGPDGFDFFTNAESDKGRQLADNPRAALGFHWKSRRRQVRVRGPVERLGETENDRWFESRPRDAQVGTWASPQSRIADSPDTLAGAVARYTAEFEGRDMPRPPHWGGFRVVPTVMEFWLDRPDRMHERLRFRRPDPDTAWTAERLFP